MAALGLDPESVEIREVATDDQAVHEHFVGSPTIRIEGTDIVDVAGLPPALVCRVYYRRDGRIAPTPDPADVRDALVAALRSAPATTERSPT
jgi:hypothetical protein